MSLPALVVALALIALILLLLLVLILRARARSPAAAPRRPGTVQPHEDAAEREARHQAVDELGTELIERRVELDSRRGTLGGDRDLLEALDRLEERRRNGEISDEQFEAEKVRLLGG
jgi:uncharacterized membrane protein